MGGDWGTKGEEEGGAAVLICSGLRCVTGPAEPSALGTKGGNLFCHNMARGLSTPHLFVWRSVDRADTHAAVTHTHTHTNQTHTAVWQKLAAPMMAVCRGSEVAVMWGESRASSSWAAAWQSTLISASYRCAFYHFVGLFVSRLLSLASSTLLLWGI